MKNSTTPMNFRVPLDLKTEFERTCRSLNLPMTAQLIFMMREFVRSETALQKQHATDNADPLPFFINHS